MDDVPDFDDDDLINDYINDDSEPDHRHHYNHEYDDEMIDEVMRDQHESAAGSMPNDTIRVPLTLLSENYTNNNMVYNDETTNDASNVLLDRTATTRQADGDVATGGGDDDAAAAAAAANVRHYISRRSDQNNLFAFDTYARNAKWRSSGTPKDRTTMEANEWKRKHSIATTTRIEKALGHGTKTRNSMGSSEAQLLEFLQHRNTSPTKIVLNSKRQNGILLQPKQGLTTIAMTLGDGTRVYVKVQPNARDIATTTKEMYDASTCDPLGVSMQDLMRRVEHETRRTIHAKIRAESRTTQSMPSQPSQSTTIEHHQKDHHQLWVDKHAPTGISHLLSDERTNREVLRALRAWDPYVFAKDPPPRPSFGPKEELTTSTNDTSQPNPQPTYDKRPDEKNRVILLEGPPGVGKTTLAHLVARHAGYRPMEVNASDERSTATLTERVRRAMESTISWNTVLSKGSSGKNDDLGRPNCLILDEIDGADAKGAVASIVQFIKAEMPPKGNKGKHGPYLRRPIIFICNHKHSPALRPLLPLARCFHVNPPSSNRLVARLKAVLNAQKFSLSGGTSLLHQLVKSCGGDIRNCLYTLQFASAQRAKNTNDISQSLLSSLRGSGLKDDRSDVAGTITTVFRKLKTQKRMERSRTVKGDPTSRLGGSENDENNVSSASRVIASVEAFGDDSKTLNTLFLNIPRVSYIDPTLDRCAAAHEWLSGGDLFRSNKIMCNNQMEHYILQRFHIPSIAGAIHLLCRVELRPNLTFSTRELSDQYYQTEVNHGLVQKFQHGIPCAARSTCSSHQVLGTETIPLSLWILSAGDGSSSLDRTASTVEVLSKPERASFDAHVGVLKALGLTYAVDQESQLEQIDGHGSTVKGVTTVQMRLEPPIDRLVRFKHFHVSPQSQRREIPDAMKELISHHVHMEGFRQRDKQADSKDVFGVKSTGNKSLNDKENVPKTPTKKTLRQSGDIASLEPCAKRIKTSPSSVAANFLGIGARKARAAKSARKAAMVGLVGSNKSKLTHSGTGLQLSQVLRLRYVKGFTQAVRTPARLSDLE